MHLCIHFSGVIENPCWDIRIFKKISLVEIIVKGRRKKQKFFVIDCK